MLQSTQGKPLAPCPAVHLLRFDGSAPRPSRSRSVIGSRMAGARRAADMVDQSGRQADRLLAPGRVICAAWTDLPNARTMPVSERVRSAGKCR